MVVLIDTNVALNYILKREPYFHESDQIMAWCAAKVLDGYLAFHSLSIIWYVLRKMPDEERRGWLRSLCTILDVASATTEEVLDALEKVKFKDFEDCLQDKCACHIHADFIVTGNIKDYSDSVTKAMNPADFCTYVREGRISSVNGKEK